MLKVQTVKYNKIIQINFKKLTKCELNKRKKLYELIKKLINLKNYLINSTMNYCDLYVRYKQKANGCMFFK